MQCERAKRTQRKEVSRFRYGHSVQFVHYVISQLTQIGVYSNSVLHMLVNGTLFSDAEEYREEVRRSNQDVFEKERAEREKVREQAKTVLDLLTINPNGLRDAVPWMVGKTDEEIREMAMNILELVDSPHPMRGFWDSHGRIVDRKEG